MKKLKSLAQEKDTAAFVAKAMDLKKEHKLDLSMDEDLSIAIMNLISIEEHFFFTASKTKKDSYIELLRIVREMRKKLLKQIIKEYEGEVWCISKHLLAASMRLMEVGTKQLTMKKNKKAKIFFGQAYDLYLLFWGLNLKVIKSKEIAKIGEEGGLASTGSSSSFKSALKGEAFSGLISKGKKIENEGKTKKRGMMGRLDALVKKVVDCCIE